jgi:excinuclease ABC subunit A
MAAERAAGPRPGDTIVVRGARQNNLRNLDVDIPTGELVVVTGVSGSGKSSLVFDTLYAEGQRRYVETFSPYARQFLDRMDKPAVDRIEGIPPAIAIDQTNPVRTSRSTVGTMTELNDHLKLLFARASQLYCSCCGRLVRRDSPQSIAEDALARAARLAVGSPDGPGAAQAGRAPLALVCFRVDVPKNFKETEVRALLERQGYSRLRERGPRALEVVQDRLRLAAGERSRLTESLEAALRVGRGRVAIHLVEGDAAAVDAAPARETWRYSSELHCADCDLAYREPLPAAFSFNSPAGACDTCRGFGRVIGVDYGLVIPDESRTLEDGAIKPWQTDAYSECQEDLERLGRKRGIPLDVPWRDLTAAQRAWVIDGEGKWAKNVWYGVRRFFEWLESRAYKMHIRVLLSRYRSYTPCAACDGARLKTEALLWRLGERALADEALGGAPRFRPVGTRWDEAAVAALPGLCLHDIVLLPLARTRRLFDSLRLPGALDAATDLLLSEIRSRLRFLDEVGLGYLTLDRQSRTLSGGEVQRINLTTALGTSLVNTLFVLDEPSIGLHPRDMQRVIGVMHRLRDAGNSLVIVEHDPQIMLEADRILDMGPGAGEHGGRIVCFGTPAQLRAHPQSLTGAWLASFRRMPAIAAAHAAPAAAGALRLRGVAEHNLRDIDVEFPLRRLVCVTGVSGSGKSTLVQDVLYPALRKAKGQPSETPGRFAALEGAGQIEAVVLVDQAPIGRTARSNPASYVGAFDAIRARFARLEAARERGWTASTFSFNSGTGRCPTCSGNGFEHVEMQFLSDVYLRCADCNGRRYRAETLELRCTGADGRAASVADVLDMTVTEALAFFADDTQLAARLAPLRDVGLDYLRLGQPVPTLSGGEAQRLKLAGHLAEAGADGGAGGKLFLFDEPTTGLHFEDVAKLLSAFRQLLEAGHSLVVVEHNLDVIGAADWIIDLGPEGGEHGGAVVATGTPAQLAAVSASHTGRALAAYGRAPGVAEPAAATAIAPARPAAPRAGQIVIRNAREHNLKGVDVEIPRERFTVLTGVSGSGKSTLAFDILFNEGQRRYLESLNAYARQFVQPAARPEVDAIFGIPPTVAIEQRTSRGGVKSTVATLTEVHHFLRLLYVKLGTQFCPTCDVAIEPQSADAVAARILRVFRGRSVQLLAPLVVARKGYYTDLAKWAAAKGYARLRVDGALVPVRPFPRLDRFREHDIELPVAELAIGARGEPALREALARALEIGKGVVRVLAPGDAPVVYSTRRACPTCGTSFAEPDPRLFSYNSKTGWCGTCTGTGLAPAAPEPPARRRRREREQDPSERIAREIAREVAAGDDTSGDAPCPACAGRRLNPVALAVRFRERSIADLACEPVSGATAFFAKLRTSARETAIARDLLAEIRSRLEFLGRVGLGYLQLDRAAPTLSGGEAQRIRLAAQLGSSLRGVCYVLDEPTIGLHPRDNRILLDALGALAAGRNTLVVVEHDEDTIRRADHVIDLGPGAGVHGGAVVARGRIADLIAEPASLTGRYLRTPLQHPQSPRRPVGRDTPSLVIEGATLHNLADVDARIPLGRLTVVTGVSGSGKSTLARDILFENARRGLAGDTARAGRRAPRAPRPDETTIGCRALRGLQALERALEVDQTPIGKTPRSCPATYVGLWDEVRRIYAATTEAKMRGWTASRFSFNAGDGRCATCEGQGLRTIEMSFLPDVKVTCETCGGRRFNAETLAVEWRGRSIAEVLALSIEDAAEAFRAHASLHATLQLLVDVGLGYLTLGQPSPTLSGGEAQRIKLVAELARVRSPEARPRAGARAAAARSTLYVLDEPTVGLHMADVQKLVVVLHRLVDAGNTVVVVEHNLDLVAEADWVVDLGPEAGAGGGRVVAQASPQALAARGGAKRSHTAAALAEHLRRGGILAPAPGR